MNTQSVTMQFDPATAATLRTLQAKAEAKGQTLNALLQSFAESDNGSSHPAEQQMTPDERAAEFVQWLKDHSVKDVIADDSRESTYTREDQAL